jgi:hypothetical protein
MKRTFSFLLLAASLAAASATVPGEIARKGDPIFADDFSRSELGPEWIQMIPTYAVKDGRLVGTQSSEWHGSVAFIKADMKDCVLEFRFRLKGARGFNVVWDDRTYPGTHAGHICRVSILSTQIRLADDKHGSMRKDIFAMRRDPKRRAEAAALVVGREAAAPIKLEQDRWYALKVEMIGDAMRATLDGEPVCFLRSSGIDHLKRQFYFTILEKSVEFDDLKIWQALPLVAK